MIRTFLAIAALFLAFSPAVEAADAASPWQALTRADVEAGYSLLAANHPAATPEAGDSAFIAALAAAHAKALERAASVDSYEGYVATLGEMANSMGDGHIWSNPRFLPRTVSWAGLIAARRGSIWVVARAERPADPALAGSRILECDGLPIDAVARAALRFRGNVALEPSLTLRGAWLLVDEGNPFLRRPTACLFDQGGKRTTVTLDWNPIARSDLVANHWNRPFGVAGYGLRPSGQGFWISIQELGPDAQAVVDAARARTADLRRAPYVVVDLRGNGGGSDAYGRALAEAIYGPGAVLAALGPQDATGGGCDEVFRASPGNIATVSADAELMRKGGVTVGAEEYGKAVTAMKAATAAGRRLAGDLSCRRKQAPSSPVGVSLMPGKVFVLTDVACFSSCIQTVGFFRALGATQVGQSTGADTHYSEVHEIVLPSGLATFSTLRAIMPDEPREIGPYAPRVVWDGDMADTPALEAWIAGLAR